MLKTKYYCLIAGLPELNINDKTLSVSSLEFKHELSEQLQPADYKLAELLYFKYDNENLLNLILKKDKTFNNLGKYSHEELLEQIKEPTYIVGYMNQFIIDYKNKKTEFSDLILEKKLQTLFFDFVLQTKNEFLKKWFEFDMNIKNILTAINCRKYDYNIEKQLIKVKHTNEVFQNLLKETPKLDSFSDEVMYAKEIFQIAESEDTLSEKENAIDQIKLKFLEEFTFFKYFNIEKILAFIILLNIIERWSKVDNKAGEKIFKKIISNLQFTISD